MVVETEVVNLGSALAGVGGLIFFLVLAYLTFRIGNKIIQWYENVINLDMKMNLVEEIFLDKMATQKGWDLNKELAEREALGGLKRKNRGFKKRLTEQIFNEFFEKKQN